MNVKMLTRIAAGMKKPKTSTSPATCARTITPPPAWHAALARLDVEACASSTGGVISEHETTRLDYDAWLRLTTPTGSTSRCTRTSH